MTKFPVYDTWQEIEIEPNVWVDLDIYRDEDTGELCIDVYRTEATAGGMRVTLAGEDPIKLREKTK